MYFTEAKAYPTCQLWFHQLQHTNGYNCHSYRYTLVIIDHFTSYAQTYATHNKSGETITETLFNDLEFLTKYSIISLGNLKNFY